MLSLLLSIQLLQTNRSYEKSSFATRQELVWIMKSLVNSHLLLLNFTALQQFQ